MSLVIGFEGFINGKVYVGIYTPKKLFTKRDLTPNRRYAIILSTAFLMGLTFTLVGELIMTPAENIYRSDYDEVDGLLELNEDAPELELVPEEGWDDDGQPTMYEEYQDLYGGDDWDHGQFDSPEDYAF
jgi:hypothetical protein